MRVLLLTPPMTQLNTPYPATAYLTGFLRQHAARARARGRAGRRGARAVPARCSRAPASTRVPRARAERRRTRPTRRRSIAHFLAQAERYVDTVDAVDALPAGPRPGPGAAHRRPRASCPRGRASPRSPGAATTTTIRWPGRSARSASTDRAQAPREPLRRRPRRRDPRRHRPALRARRATASGSPRARRRFDPLREALDGDADAGRRHARRDRRASCSRATGPTWSALTVPFPGNVYGAFRIARAIKRARARDAHRRSAAATSTPSCASSPSRACSTTSTTSRSTTASAPLLALLEHLARRARQPLLRTFVRDATARSCSTTDADAARHPAARRRHADLRRPAARSLPVAARDAEPDAPAVVRRALEQAHRRARLLLEEVHASATSRSTTSRATSARRRRPAGRSHRGARSPRPARPAFTSSTRRRRPPALRALAERLHRAQASRSRGGATSASRRPSRPSCASCSRARGCVAVSGGLEVASDRLLELMKKGVTVEQVARVTRAFTDAGIMVHAYLMYGFPTETAQETDRRARARAPAVRGGLHPVGVLAPLRRDGAQPDRPRARALRHHACSREPTVTFAQNDLALRRSRPAPTTTSSATGLRKALYNYMHGIGLDEDVREWFSRPAASPAAAGASRLHREGAARGRLTPMPIKPWFPTLIYTAPLRPRGNAAFARTLLEDCHKLRDHDAAGRRWSERNYPGGYTSYGSRTDLHKTFSTFMDLERSIRGHVGRFARQLEMDLQHGRAGDDRLLGQHHGRHTVAHAAPASAGRDQRDLLRRDAARAARACASRTRASTGSWPRRPSRPTAAPRTALQVSYDVAAGS